MNREKILQKSKKYFKDNQKVKQDKNNERSRERRIEDPVFKLSCNFRRNIRGILKNSGYSRKCKTIEILGCSFEEFKNHIESQFESWMNWGNHGKYNGEFNYGWDIDHIIP